MKERGLGVEYDVVYPLCAFDIVKLAVGVVLVVMFPDRVPIKPETEICPPPKLLVDVHDEKLDKLKLHEMVHVLLPLYVAYDGGFCVADGIAAFGIADSTTTMF